ncbi:FHA domain-containing protein [Nocardia sp. NPDC023852]|uniref:FHA domain-containing protein n=1 Tax=Nocardia sp. NPDC023852 TaxID=3154697 RepID=UPI0033CEF47E
MFRWVEDHKAQLAAVEPDREKTHDSEEFDHWTATCAKYGPTAACAEARVRTAWTLYAGFGMPVVAPGRRARVRRNPSTVGIAPGDGLVARFGAIVAYLGGETASTDRILGIIEAVADEEHPGAALAKRLAAVIFGSTSQPPPFGIVAPTTDGMLILLRGTVTAEIQGAEGTRHLAGARAFTWVDEIVREPVRRITIGADTGTPLTPRPRTDLRAGVVPGGGFVLHAAVRRAGKATESAARTSPPKRAAGSQPEPEPTAASGFDAMPEPTGASDAVAPVPAPPTESARPPAKPRPPRPVADRPLAWSRVQPAAQARPEPVALHKNNGGTHVIRRSVMAGDAAAGSLVAENGAEYPLDRPYVIGRGPQVDESVRAATAAPIVIQRDRRVSRVHAYVSVDGGKVYVRDAAATSGTFIAAPGTDQWNRIGTAPTELLPGWRVRISERVLTYRGEDPCTGVADIADARRRG